MSETSSAANEAKTEFLDYINANYINTFIRNKGEKTFIATQAPIECTKEKFWQMIWEHQTTTILMLCPFVGPKGEESI